MKEQELRNKVVTLAQTYLGVREGTVQHQLIIDTYNSYTPRPRGYKVTYTDAWCAAFVSVLAIKAGLTAIMPVECSCSMLLELYRAIGRWVENDNYTPSPGDLVLYDWQDSGAGDNTGVPDHVGVVETVTGATVTVIEGNYSDQVRRRTFGVGSRNIRGYCCPDYSAAASDDEEEDTTVSYDDWKKYMAQYRQELQAAEGSSWSEEDRKFGIEYGLFKGGDGKYMWQDLLTREQSASLFHRFYDNLEKLVVAAVKKALRKLADL